MKNLGIVVPTLNMAKTLSSTLLSLRPFVEDGARVLIVDGHSIDATRKIASSFDVECVSLPPGNMYAAINYGMRMMDTEWCTYVNGDDLLYHDALRSILSTVTVGADVTYGSVDFIDSMGRFLHSWNSPPVRDLAELESFVMPIPQLGTLFRRSLFDRLGGFDESYRFSADFDFFLRARRGGAVFRRFLAPRVGAFRLHGAQITQNRSSEMSAEVARSRRESGVCRTALLDWPVYLRFKMRNLDSYLIRFLRRRHLGGGRLLRVGRTVDF